MGKSLIIKGADFSVNGIAEVIDVTSLLSNYFFAQRSIGNLFSTHPNASMTRCCVSPFLFSAIGIDISRFSKIEVNVKPGYDYVFGTGPQPDNGGTDWQGWNGDTGGQFFVWVTDNQKATATVDDTTLAMSLNLRYDDNTTEFSESTVLTDMVDSIVLVP